MGPLTIEGIVEHGQIMLKDQLHLPDKTKVYVIVPEMQEQPAGRIVSPRLARPEQASDFRLEVAEDGTDASL